MRALKAKILLITIVLFVSWSACQGGMQAGTSVAGQADAAPSIVVHFHLSGVLSESPVVDPFNLTAGQVISLEMLLRRMEQARTDRKVKAVVLTFDRMDLGLGQLEEVRKAIVRLKSTGKKVYVHAGGMNTFVYSLLCAGDHFSVDPQSAIWLTGIYGQSLYVKELLDKIGVQSDFMHIGDYKSAAEMLTRTEPSEPARENVNWLLDSLYGSLVEMIAQSRGKTAEEVRALIDNGPYLAKRALEKGLIDAVETREEFLARIKTGLKGQGKIDNRYGHEKRPQINFASPFAFFSLLAEMLKTPQEKKVDTVALIYVEGTIVPGHSQPSPLGQSGGAYGSDIRKALEIAARDDSIRAVVMRVDSPGGSAEASEVILNAAKQVRVNKPLIVSMGDVAGSGGYYVSCGADAIFADEFTLTASIGVVGGKLVTTDMWDKLGVNWVDYKRGANSDMLNSSRFFNDSQRKLFMDYMQQVYEVFKGHVTKGRGDKLRKPIDQIAGGRVYTGKQAVELGLVDKIGGLNQAIDYAASMAFLEDYEVRVIPRPKDFVTQIMEQFSGEGEKPTDITMPNPMQLMVGNPAFKTIFDLLRKAEPQRAKTLYQALQRVELIRHEGVIMMMPYDITFNLESR